MLCRKKGFISFVLYYQLNLHLIAMAHKIAVIAGAGPAGLTAAYELLKNTDIHPVILEATDAIGGISQTVQYKGNRMDIGGPVSSQRVKR